MKKFSKLLLSALFISLLIIFGTSCKNEDLPTDQEIKDAAIAVIKDKIEYIDHDWVSIQSNDIYIKTPETAELLFNCIRNSEKIVDLTGIGGKPRPPYPVNIDADTGCDFGNIYIDIPQLGRFYKIVFNKSDAAAFYDRAMLLKEQEILNKAVSALQEKIVYGDSDELSVSPDGKLESIEIKTKETAELLYNCIKNSKKMVDFTGIDLEPMPHAPIKIAGEGSCYFDSIFIEIPNYYRNYQIVFTESDAAALQEHVMKLKDDYIAGQSKQ